MGYDVVGMDQQSKLLSAYRIQSTRFTSIPASTSTSTTQTHSTMSSKFAAVFSKKNVSSSTVGTFSNDSSKYPGYLVRKDLY